MYRFAISLQSSKNEKFKWVFITPRLLLYAVLRHDVSLYLEFYQPVRRILHNSFFLRILSSFRNEVYYSSNKVRERQKTSIINEWTSKHQMALCMTQNLVETPPWEYCTICTLPSSLAECKMRNNENLQFLNA